MNKIKIAGFVILLGTVFLLFGTLGYFYTNYFNGSSDTCVVLFDANGGKVDVKDKKVVLNEAYGELPVPVKKGYTFDGWFTKKDHGDKVEASTIVTNGKKHILYASWTYNIYDLDPIVSVNNTSKEDSDYYGGLYSSSKYNIDVKTTYSSLDIYSDNNGGLQYDEDGALLLDENNAIAILDVDEKYKVNNNYSLAITFYWDSSKVSNNEAFSSSVAAISGSAWNYLVWLGFDKTTMFVYSYAKLDGSFTPTINQDLRGYSHIDMSKYDKSIINVQIVGVRDKKTKVYVNGELVSEFVSDTNASDYEHLVLGDLRPGRNLKFTGKIYDFAIFDKALTNEQVKSNYLNSKAYKK